MCQMSQVKMNDGQCQYSSTASAPNSNFHDSVFASGLSLWGFQVSTVALIQRLHGVATQHRTNHGPIYVLTKIWHVGCFLKRKKKKTHSSCSRCLCRMCFSVTQYCSHCRRPFCAITVDTKRKHVAVFFRFKKRRTVLLVKCCPIINTVMISL